jgi:hypothetical protein
MLVAIQINSRGLALRNGNERSPPILCFYVPYTLLCTPMYADNMLLCLLQCAGFQSMS